MIPTMVKNHLSTRPIQLKKRQLGKQSIDNYVNNQGHNKHFHVNSRIIEAFEKVTFFPQSALFDLIFLSEVKSDHEVPLLKNLFWMELLSDKNSIRM